MSIKEHPPLSDYANSQIHVPVLLHDVIRVLSPQAGESYLDLTAGYGGHARAITEKTHNLAHTVLVDRDMSTQTYLSDLRDQGAMIIASDFVSAARRLSEAGERFDLVLADLGVSSPQLDQSERGFSFSSNGPLDMRMDQRQEETAADLIDRASVDELYTIIRDFGEEPPAIARRIAQSIVSARPLRETAELANLVAAAYRGRRGKHHPATRTFQALRIATNQELQQVAELLDLLPRIVAPGGRVGIISFHSLEDRLVKRYFAEQQASGYEAEFSVLTKKPIDGATYDVHNPRARSAKLRVAVKK